MTTPDHLLYGADFGGPCPYEEVIASHRGAARSYPRLSAQQRDAIGRNALRLFPKLAARLGAGGNSAAA